MAARFSALASLGAAVVHIAVVPAHWREWIPAGVFFLMLAVCQLCWARVVLAQTATPVLAAGVLLNAGAVALWAASRTAGAPFGPHAGQAELVHAADLCAVLLQIYVVMGAGWVWYRGRRAAPVPAVANVAISLGALAVIALASTVGVASGLSHGHHEHAGAVSDHHGAGVERADAHHHEQGTPPPVGEPTGTPAPAPRDAPAPSADPSPDTHGDHHH